MEITYRGVWLVALGNGGGVVGRLVVSMARALKTTQLVVQSPRKETQLLTLCAGVVAADYFSTYGTSGEPITILGLILLGTSSLYIFSTTALTIIVVMSSRDGTPRYASARGTPCFRGPSYALYTCTFVRSYRSG